MLRRYLHHRPLSYISRSMLLLTVAVICGATALLWLSHHKIIQYNQSALDNFKHIHAEIENKLSTHLPQHLLLQELLIAIKAFEFELTLVVVDHKRGDMQLRAIHHHLQTLYQRLQSEKHLPIVPAIPHQSAPQSREEKILDYEQLHAAFSTLLSIAANFFNTAALDTRQQLLRDVAEPVKKIHHFMQVLAVTQETRFKQLTHDNRQHIREEIDNIETIQAYLKKTELILLAVFSVALGLIALAQIFFFRVLRARLRQLGDYATTIAEGDFNTAMELDVVDDTGRLADIMQYMSHQLQQMMMRYQDALNKAEKAQEAAENANLSKSAFIADVSHELRTPLNGILGYTQLLLRDNTLTAKHRQGIQVIDKSGSHLLSLINDILDMAKMEAGRIELHTQDFILASFLQDIVELFVIRARNKHIEFNYEVCKNLPATVHADAKRLRQVLMNLLSNAIKFTRHGSVTFSICPDALGRVRFSIEDTGVGIAEEDFNAVFQPFKQVGENAQKHEGTGLGLSISKNLVAKMGGELMFKSVLGQGSTFWFAIYLPEAQNPQLARDEDIQNISGYRVLQDDIDTYKILVVDDKAENRVIVRSILEPLGFDVLEANQGCKALDIALAYHPHLILMDLVMPDVDGFQATTHFKHHPDLVHIPIVAVSASVFDADQQRSLDAGCVEFLAKPLQIPELLNCLQNHLKLKWIHGVQPQITTPAPAMTMDGPTSAQAAKIYDLADKGYISEIIDYIDELKQQCPDIQVFLSKLREHAENFDDEAVRNLVQFYMVDEDSPPNGGV